MIGVIEGLLSNRKSLPKYFANGLEIMGAKLSCLALKKLNYLGSSGIN